MIGAQVYYRNCGLAHFIQSKRRKEQMSHDERRHGRKVRGDTLESNSSAGYMSKRKLKVTDLVVSTCSVLVVINLIILCMKCVSGRRASISAMNPRREPRWSEVE